MVTRMTIDQQGKENEQRRNAIREKYNLAKPSIDPSNLNMTSARRPSVLSPIYRGVGELAKGFAGSGIETVGGLGGLAAKVIPGKKDDELFKTIREKGASMRGSSGLAQVGGLGGDILSIATGAGWVSQATRLPKLAQLINSFSKVKGIRALTPYLPEAVASTALTGLQQQDQITSGKLGSEFTGEVLTNAALGKFGGALINKYKAAKQIPTEGLEIPSGTQQIPSGTQQIPSGTQQAKEGLQYIPDEVLEKKVQPISKKLKESTFLTNDAPLIRLIANAQAKTRKAIEDNIEKIKNLPNDPNLPDEVRKNIYIPLVEKSIESSFKNGKQAGQVIGKYKNVIKQNNQVQQKLRNYLSSNMDEIVRKFNMNISEDGKLIGEFPLIPKQEIAKIISLPTASADDLQNSIQYFSKVAGQELKKGNLTGFNKINEFKKALQKALAEGLDTKQRAEFLKANEQYSKYKTAQGSIFKLLKLSDADKAALTNLIDTDDNINFNQKVAERIRTASNLNFANLLETLNDINKSATNKIDIEELKRTTNLVENIIKTTGGENARTFKSLITTAIETAAPKANMLKQAGELYKAIKPGVELDLGQARKNAEAIKALIDVFSK